MVHMPNRPNVAMRLVGVEFLFGHGSVLSAKSRRSLGKTRAPHK
jgi:hypothetical protein